MVRLIKWRRFLSSSSLSTNQSNILLPRSSQNVYNSSQRSENGERTDLVRSMYLEI